MVASYYFLGFLTGNDVAIAAKWTAVFAATSISDWSRPTISYRRPPSPLQHMWSLGVEEQFYVVWPDLFLLLVLTVREVRSPEALAATLLLIMGVSLSWSDHPNQATPRRGLTSHR